MNKAIETILFTGCGHFRLMAEYFSHNAARLAGHGVLYPKSGSRELAFGYDQYPIVHYLAENDQQSVLRAVQGMEEEILSSPQDIKTLCLLLPAIVYSNPEALHTLQTICAKIFPSAAGKIFFSLTRQDLFLEKNVLTYCYTGYDYFLYEKKFPLPDYTTIFRRLNVPEANNVALFSPQAPSPSAQEIVNGLNAALGIARPEAKALAAAFHPRYDRAVPREVLCFIDRCTVSRRVFTPFASPEPWADQLRRFTPEAGYVADTCSLSGPRYRADTLARFAASNADAAKMLGVERLFPDPEPEPNWQPWPDLTEETAFRVAERLDRDFAAARLAEFDAAPRQYLNYEQRLCQQALRDAFAPASTAFLPHTPAPQPRLSVLTLTYNHAPYIAECMESVMAQKTDFPFLHIIADDGSDDGTQEIILEYAAKYPHIVPLFQKTNSHGWLNVKSLFEMARTEYVALCDGDDYFTDPAKLQTQVDFLNAHPECALCFHPVQVIYEDGTTRSRVYPPRDALPRGVRPFYYLTDLLRFNMIQTNSVIYRWRFKNGLPHWFRTDLLPGDWYWHILHAEMGRIGFIDRVMSVYRRHKKSVYYSAEGNTRLHRAKTGMQELEVYAAINKHFNDKYTSILGDMANGVFSDVLLHADETGDTGTFDAVVEEHPEFAAHFLLSLKKLQE